MARVDIGHGQMEEEELETVMQRFVQGEIDVLISTTIIESGLDIPNANTIIIDSGRPFRLSGSLPAPRAGGTGQHKAYAYLLLPRDLMAVGAARRRINAIKQYSGLGAGFKIAMRDLEIRGAGTFSATAQSGHIINIGFDLYCSCCSSGRKADKAKGSQRSETYLRLDFVVPTKRICYCPEGVGPGVYTISDYIAQPQTRIESYKTCWG